MSFRYLWPASLVAFATACVIENTTTDDAERCAENISAVCDDGKDNDGDGFTDCDDIGCSGVAACDKSCGQGDPCFGPETSLEACKDGKDNDGNGFIDCNDFSCSKSSDQAILDYCAQSLETSLEACKDGIDNDGNGFTDCEDFSCVKSSDQAILDYCAEQLANQETTLEKCSDGIDNDGNGFTDCDDFSCWLSPEPEITKYCDGHVPPEPLPSCLE